jgi:hypothetical protein
MLYQVHLAWAGYELTTLVVIGTDCIGSYNQLPYDHDHDGSNNDFEEDVFNLKGNVNFSQFHLYLKEESEIFWSNITIKNLMLENSEKKDFKSVVLSHQFLLIIYVHSYTHVLVYNLIKTRSLIAQRCEVGV